MAQRSLFWDGTVLGDCGPYTQADLQDRFFRAILNGTGDRGVLSGWLNNLEPTGTSSPISVNTGAAVVYGMFYLSDAPVAVSIPTPSAALPSMTTYSRYDRIVVRRDWNEQTVRLARVSGVASASPTIPALTQTAGSIYEIPIATILIDINGIITLTDTRDYAAYTTEWPGTVVTADMFIEEAVTAAKIPDRTRYELKGAGQFMPNSANPCTWTAGASYDYWAFADAATNRGWVYFMGPPGLVGTIAFYVWSVPDVNGAGGGVENCQWDYSIYYGAGVAAPLTNVTGTINVDQQARLNTTVYRDQLVAALPAAEGHIIAIRLSRDGAADSYNSAMRLLGVEMYFTADA